MRSIAALSVLLLLTIGSISCKKDGKSYKVTGDYMIIGNPGGFIALPVLTFYSIANGQLRKDTTVPYSAVPDDISKFNFDVVLPAAKYDAVKGLLKSVPSELLGRNNEHIGTMFVDAGYTDVRTVINGVAYRWYFEGDQRASSTAVQQFVQNARAVFE